MDTHILPRRIQLAIVSAGALVLVVGASVAVWALSSAPAQDAAAQSGMSSSAQSAVVAAQSASRSSDPSNAVDGGAADASARVEAVLTAISELLADPAAARKADVSTILSGYALDEFNAQVDEWEKEGMHQEGVATVESAKIVESADDGSSFVLEACVDSADVRVLNEAGMDLRHDQTTRWLTDFTFVRADGAWKLDKQSFPDDPTC